MKHNKLSKLGACFLVAFGLSAAANAAFINGTIEFGGTATLQDEFGGATTDLAAAWGVKTWPSAYVTLATGDYAAIPSFPPNYTPVTLAAPWIFNPSTATPSLWSIPAYGVSFDLGGATIVSQSNSFLNVTGNGIAKMTGFSDSSGTWSFTIPSAGSVGTFTWASSGTATPDGGTTLALLGCSMLGLGAIRRKFGKG